METGAGAPLCSVIIPAYGCERYIGRCIASALAQTAEDLEVIVIDDASQDGTAEIVERFVREDRRVRCITLARNGGVANARNCGISAARGEWVAFLDSDDAWAPDKLERQFALQSRTQAELIYSAARCFDEAGNDLAREFRVPAAVSYEQLLRRNDLVCSSVLVRRAWMLQNPFESGEVHEDYICWVRLLEGGCRAAGVQEPLVWYRLREGSKSHDKRRSARMLLRSYRVLGLSIGKQIPCFAAYVLHGLRRYA